MRFLLDTNICIYFLKENKTVVNKFALLKDSDLAISSINLAELLYGAYNSEHITKNLERVQFIERTIQVLDLDRNSIDNYARIKAKLRKQGNLIDDFDLLIGAIALSNNLVLVTNNEKHFCHIPNLQIENWTK